MTVVNRKCFWNIRLHPEMPRWKRLVWRIFGERVEGTDNGYTVVGYRFRNVTLVTSITHEEEGEIQMPRGNV